MSNQKSKLDHIDDLNFYLKQSEALTSALMCADLHDPSDKELNGIFSLLNDQIRKIQKSFNQYIECQEVNNENVST